ncbi:hypothetical protein MIMGU_mgv1a001923mg [Erythranthe guttata]|uniref:C2 domain-containing protein n=1 Tax=Erythranthe guttata TaxID=4155 RepID=A0A022Q6Y6_ERYGU|nr:hypothetical protein MIMGU_mgv1a001923mg [Erythranthe guttata]
MAALQSHPKFMPAKYLKPVQFKNPRSFSFSKKVLLSRKLFSDKKSNGFLLLGPRFSKYYCCKASAEIDNSVSVEESVEERPPFDINLAVILAGFAFEAYTTPPGTSDPYVIMQLDCQEVKSKIKWGTKEPKWNEEFTLNIKQPPMHNLQVAAWDANLVTPHKRMGNACIDLENLCDGNSHEVLLDLEGMGGGGKIEVEIKYKSFEKMDDEKKWWKIPIVTEFFQKNGFEPALKMIIGSDQTVPAREFVQFAFGQLKSINNSYLQKDWFSSSSDAKNLQEQTCSETGPTNETNSNGTPNSPSEEKQFWKNLADSVNQKVAQKFGLPLPEKIKWEGFDLLKNIGIQSREIAETSYVESGLATPNNQDTISDDAVTTTTPNASSLPDIKKVTQEILRQTDSILGALMVVNAAVSKLHIGVGKTEEVDKESKRLLISDPNNTLVLSEKEDEEMKALFSTAESAMEAWAMLANALGHPTFIKSEFEKICFFDNEETDTQVAIWRDLERERLVIAFRGTEQVHSGFLNAYDSVRTRLISLIKQAIGYRGDSSDQLRKWHIYVTGHSLGGALATLMALELSSSQLAKHGAINVTMYNFGSPRVGNKIFAQVYNQKVKDSWRVVNHRDIIPTVPRLMGYCHVAQPVYLAARDIGNTKDNLDVLEDGYQGDVIGEATPDVLVTEFMRGERELVENILNTEINIFRSIRDGSALMQHMEDFYYITLLENVRSNYQSVGGSKSADQKLSA